MKKQVGQIILGLVLVMVVALGIGLSVVQKSLVDISTSSKVEQSSRAFSAAEAGIEKYLNSTTSCTSSTCNVQFAENASAVSVQGGLLLPIVPATGRQDPLEYPLLAKEEVAHFWLADFMSSSNPPPTFYTQPTLDLYWGNSSTDKAALEVTLVYYDGSQIKSQKWFLDQISRGNNFTLGCNSTSSSSLPNYTCKYTLIGLPTGLMLLRTRLLYNSNSQPVAIQAVGVCGQACSIPPQAKIIRSTGIAGETQRVVQVFQIEKVVPPYFDFAIFSSGDIKK